MTFVLAYGCLYLTLHLTISAAAFTCPTLFNWYPDIHDCSKFYRCVWGKGYIFQCPKGTLWSHDMLTCHFKELVKCSKDFEKHVRHHSEDILQDNNQKKLDFLVDYEEDVQSFTENSKREEETNTRSPKGAENELGENTHLSSKFKEENDGDENQSIDNHEHNHYLHENSESNIKIWNDDFKKDQNEDKWATKMYNVDYSEEGEDSINGDFVDSTQDVNNDDSLDIEHDSQNKKGNTVSEKRPQSPFLKSRLFFKEETTEHPKHKFHLYHEGSNPSKTSQKPHSDSIFNSSTNDMKTKIILSKLLQLQRYNDHIQRQRNFINTDGTYDVLDMELFPGLHGHIGQYEPWSSSDIFRAGYGYKRIYHKV